MGDVVQSYRDRLIWQKGIALARSIYELTGGFPQHEIYGLANQMRRSATSVPSNIAEAQAGQHTGEFRQCLHIALGSAAELDTQSVIARELGYFSDQQAQTIEAQLIELSKMIFGLLKSLPGS